MKAAFGAALLQVGIARETVLVERSASRHQLGREIRDGHRTTGLLGLRLRDGRERIERNELSRRRADVFPGPFRR